MKSMKRLLPPILSCTLMMPPSFAMAKDPFRSGQQRVEQREIQNGRTKFFVQQSYKEPKKFPSQTLIMRNKGVSELIIDHNQDGKTDVWSIDNGRTQVKAESPVRGIFRNVTIERKEKNGVRTIRLGWIRALNSYYVEAQSFQKHKVMNQEVATAEQGPALNENALAPYAPSTQPLILGTYECKNPPDTMSEMVKGWRAIVDGIGGDFTNRMLGLNDKLKTEFKLIDDSCKQPPWDKSYESITKGIAEVMASRTGRPKQQPRFLACLDRHNLGYYGAKLEQNFQRDAVQGTQPSVRCEVTSRSSQQASFFQDTIRFHKPLNMAAKHEGEMDHDYYARAFFHEALHKAGIRDEGLCHQIEMCCGGADSSPDSKACQDLTTTTRGTQTVQTYHAYYSEHVPGYYETRYQTMVALGDNLGQDFLHSYFSGLHERNMSAAQLAKDCNENTSAGGEIERPECSDIYIKKISDYNQEFFNGKCLSYLAGRTKDQARKICGQLYSQFEEMFTGKVETAEQCSSQFNCTFSNSKKAESAWNWLEKVAPHFAHAVGAASAAKLSPSLKASIKASAADECARCILEQVGYFPEGKDPINLSGPDTLYMDTNTNLDTETPKPPKVVIPPNSEIGGLSVVENSIVPERVTTKPVDGSSTDPELGVEGNTSLTGRPKPGYLKDPKPGIVLEPKPAVVRGNNTVTNSGEAVIEKVKFPPAGESENENNETGTPSTQIADNDIRNETVYETPVVTAEEANVKPLDLDNLTDTRERLIERTERADSLMARAERVVSSIGDALIPKGNAANKNGDSRDWSRIYKPPKLFDPTIDLTTSDQMTLAAVDTDFKEPIMTAVDAAKPKFARQSGDEAARPVSAGPGGGRATSLGFNGNLPAGNPTGDRRADPKNERKPANQNQSKKQDLSLAGVRKTLEGDYEIIKLKLKDFLFISALKEHQIQVINHENIVFGSLQPKYEYLYDKNLKRLKLKTP